MRKKLLEQGHFFCGFNIGSITGIPILNQKGYSTEFPSYCECQDFGSYSASEQSQCNYFEFIYGFMFWNTTDTSPIISYLTALLSNGVYAQDAISHSAYNISYIASYWGQSSPLYDTYSKNSTLLETAFKFCHVENFGYCSILAISALGTIPPDPPTDYSVSTYYYQLKNCSCNPILAIPNQNFQNLVTTPFTNLVQDYQTCLNDDFTNVVAAAGIATGNVGFLTPFAIMFSLFVAYFLSRCFGFQIPYTYQKQDRSDVLDALAFNLLLARDEKHKGKLQSKNVVLKNIVEELAANAHINPFVVDDFSTSLNVKRAKKAVATSLSGRNSSRSLSRQTESKNPMSLELRTFSANTIEGDDDMISLNSSKSLTSSAGEGISATSYLPKLQVLLSELKECITNAGGENQSPASTKRSFWEIIVSTNEFNDIALDISDPDALEDQTYIDFISALRELMLLHAETSLGIEQAVLKSHYRSRIFYSFVNGLVVTLADLDRILTMA